MTTPLRAVGALSLTATAALALVLVAPLTASAHVTIDDDTADPGDYALVTFKVPNESESAATTGLTIQLPSDTPFTSVRYVPIAGWTTELVTTTLPEPVAFGEGEITEAVTSVVITAEPGAELSGRELGLFTLSLGAVPEVGSIAFPTEQRYSDGTTVSWSEAADGEHPAPLLFVTDAPVEHEHAGAPVAGVEGATDVDHSTAPDAATDPFARTLGIVGIVIGLAGIAVAAAAVLRRGKAA